MIRFDLLNTTEIFERLVNVTSRQKLYGEFIESHIQDVQVFLNGTLVTTRTASAGKLRSMDGNDPGVNLRIS